MLKRRENGITLNLELKLEKAEKEQKTKIGTKSKVNQQKRVMNMPSIYPMVLIITLNVNDLNASIRRQRLSEWIKKQDHLHVA